MLPQFNAPVRHKPVHFHVEGDALPRFAVAESVRCLQHNSLCRKEESGLSQTLNAFDFSQVRSKKDRELLYEAKYGERGADGKMTREQYAALRRKVGGTAKDYWKDWVRCA